MNKPIRTLIIANYQLDNQRSMSAYAEFIAGCHRHANLPFTIIRPPALFGRVFSALGMFNKWVGYVDKYIIFPFILFCVHWFYDRTFIIDHSNALYAPALLSGQRVMTCHDVIAIEVAQGVFPGRSSGRLGCFLQQRILHGLSKAHAIVCVSDSTQQRLRKLLNGFAGSMITIANPLYQASYDVSKDQRREDLKTLIPAVTGAYFLHVGSDVFYKNRLGAFRIFEHIASQETDVSFVFVGEVRDEVLSQAISASNFSDKISILNNVSSRDLATLYHEAEALIYPSLAEGFGWPIIEAQANQCVVATSHWDPMKTLAGTAGIVIDPEDYEGSARKILDGILTKADRVEQGLKQVSAFQPELIRQQYCDWLFAICDK